MKASSCYRRGRPTPAAPVVVDELDAFDEDELLYVLVNYHRSPLGAWTATVAPDGLEPVTLQATSAHDAGTARRARTGTPTVTR